MSARRVRGEGRTLVVAYCEPDKPDLRWQVHSLFASFLDHAPEEAGFLVTLPPGTERYLDPRIPYRTAASIHGELRHPALARIGLEGGYPFANHFLAARGLEGRAERVLLTDCDTALTARFGGIEPRPFLVGQGAFFSETSRERLAAFAERHGYRRYGRLTNLSATWYGEGELLARCAEETLALVRALLEEEDWSKTSWPEWWVGVLTLYAAEIVLNERVEALEQRPGLLDGHARSEEDEEALHLHMWHVTDPARAFCKFVFEAGGYDRYEVPLQGNAALLLRYARRGRALCTTQGLG